MNFIFSSSVGLSASDGGLAKRRHVPSVPLTADAPIVDCSIKKHGGTVSAQKPVRESSERII